LLDHPTTEIGVDQAIICPMGCVPKIGVGNTSFPRKADERLAFVDRQRFRESALILLKDST